jgi:hypothetical protein
LLDAIDPATQKTLADALRRATLQIEALLAQAGTAEPDPQGKDSQ